MVELIVAMAIVVVVCALVLPAVQQAREAARRVACSNNLHQIGVALGAYQSAARSLPPGWVIELPVGSESRSGWGWLAMLLPEAEQGPLFNAINFSQHVGDVTNATARTTTVALFLCPTDHVPPRVPFYSRAPGAEEVLTGSDARGVMFDVAGASYPAVLGPDDPAGDRPDMTGPGAFFANSHTRAADFVDGLGQTLLVGERSARRLATTWTGIHQLEEEGPERVIGFAERGPNAPDADEAAFSSRHPGGVHFLFGDGSVRFLRDSMNEAIYRAMSTRAGQEVMERTEF